MTSLDCPTWTSSFSRRAILAAPASRSSPAATRSGSYAYRALPCRLRCSGAATRVGAFRPSRRSRTIPETRSHGHVSPSTDSAAGRMLTLLAPVRTAPSDALTPGDGVPKPTDVLVARLHELKRLAKSLAAFYGTLGHAHEQQGKTLAKVASDETLRLPWLEQNLFLPPKGAPNGEGGWAELVGQLKEGTDREGEPEEEPGARSDPSVRRELITCLHLSAAGDHYEVARIASAEVVEPLKQLVRGLCALVVRLKARV